LAGGGAPLPVPAGRIGAAIESLIRRKDLGLLAVSTEVTPVIWPRARQPWRDAYRSVQRQLETGVRAREWSTFTYNLPTHYLAWTLALRSGDTYSREPLSDCIAPYEAMPKDERAALRGAETLGLVDVRGDAVGLTPTGEAVGEIIGVSLSEWSDIHRRALRSTLVDIVPRAGAVLRIVLLRDPMIRLIIRGLRDLDHNQGSMRELVQACDAIDHDRAPALFFHPERVEEITTSQGRIRWSDVEGIHFRSTTFYQAKSILKHAGILRDTGLGGASAKDYVPDDDRWALRD